MEGRFYEVSRGEWHVDAWSTVRLPFEPKGWLRDYRSDLQSALRSMRATENSLLYGEYGAPDRALADLENVLLYNVGSGCIAHLAQRGLVCRRVTSADGLHHVAYTSMEASDVPTPISTVLATARLAKMPPSATPAHWWAAFRGRLQVLSASQHDGEFGVLAEMGSTWRGGLVTAIKSFLDGLVAALHVHDGSNHEHVRAALDHLGNGELMWDLLNDPAIAILGRRRLVRPHGQNIAWNPADERCGHFELVRSNHEGAANVTITAL